jgi:hypothetical protein
MASTLDDLNDIDLEDDEASFALLDGAVAVDDDTAILELFKEYSEEGKADAFNPLLIGERNEAWTDGHQFTDINPGTSTLEDAWITGMPRLSQNYLRQLVNTFKARITQQRPSVGAFATNASPEAARAAEISSKLIDYLEKEMQIDTLIDNVVGIGTMHGTAGFKIIYSPDAQVVQWYPLSIEDYWIDGSTDNYESANWVIFKTFLDKFDAKKLYRDNNLPGSPPEEEFRPGVNQRNRIGTPVYELWHKPTSRVPQGLYCKIIGTNVIDNMAFPYIMNSLENPGQKVSTLPIVLYRTGYKRGSQYGTTWLTDAIPQQRQVNEVEAALVELRRKFSSVKLVVQNVQTAQAVTSGNQILISPDVPQYMRPPEIPQLLFADRSYYVKNLYDVAGINDALVGTAPAGAASGRALAYLDELDSQKHGGTTKSLEAMLIRAWTLTLQLIQSYYKGERIMRITLDQGGYDTMAFQASDIEGVTVQLPPRSGKERFPQSKIAQIEADAAAGLVPQAQIPEARITASAVPMATQATKAAIQKDVQFIQQGAQPQVNPQLDPAAAVAELQSLHQLLLGKVEERVLLGIEQLAEMYLQLLQPAPQGQAPQQPAAPVPEGLSPDALALDGTIQE